MSNLSVQCDAREFTIEISSGDGERQPTSRALTSPKGREGEAPTALLLEGATRAPTTKQTLEVRYFPRIDIYLAVHKQWERTISGEGWRSVGEANTTIDREVDIAFIHTRFGGRKDWKTDRISKQEKPEEARKKQEAVLEPVLESYKQLTAKNPNPNNRCVEDHLARIQRILLGLEQEDVRKTAPLPLAGDWWMQDRLTNDCGPRGNVLCF